MAEAPPSGAFPIEAIAVFPAPGMAVPGAFAFTADDAQVFYLAGSASDANQQLLLLDCATGARRVAQTPPGGGTQEATLSPEEELRRQRQRMLATGITHFALHAATGRILVPQNGSLFVQDSIDAPLRLLLDAPDAAPAQDATFSADGGQVAYVQNDEVWVIPTAGGDARQITHGAQERGVTHGLAEYVAQEELGRETGLWWSPDGAHIAFAEVDERHIPPFQIMHAGSDSVTYEEHRYPFAGAANAHVRLGIVPVAGGDPVWADLAYGEDIYLARVFWWPDGDLGAEILNRVQDRLDLVRFSITTGQRTSVLTEESAHWITMRTKHRHVLADGSLVWASERSGFNHLYRYTFLAGGTPKVLALTEGAWAVDSIASVDEARGIVYFTGNREDPTEQHLYAVPLAGGQVRRITTQPGMHGVTLDHACERFVDVHHSLTQPPTVTLRRLADDALVQPIFTPEDPRLAEFHLTPPEIVTLPNRAGTMLYGAIYRPPADRFGAGPYPTIVEVYGGPGPQTVQNAWPLCAALRTHYLRGLGYLVFRLDNRGSARRGLAFESALQGRMGTIEVDDQVDGVQWLVAQGLADPARVGVIGWSYGGYMALMCLAKAPQIFRVAVAGAPVTSWDGYDTAYTERYMATPQANPTGYAQGSVLQHAAAIQGKLLLIHGMLDENVHFRHTARLINALIAARIPYDLLAFPDERHMPRRQADRVYLHERTIGFFQEHL
jgi:dipeptidyl-peptidase-4